MLQRREQTEEFCGAGEYRGLKFINVHIGADEWHTEVGRNFVERFAESPEREPARRCLVALWSFLAGVNESAHAPDGAE